MAKPNIKSAARARLTGKFPKPDAETARENRRVALRYEDGYWKTPQGKAYAYSSQEDSDQFKLDSKGKPTKTLHQRGANRD